MKGIKTNKTTLALLTLVCGLLLHLPCAESWLWQTEDEKTTAISTISVEVTKSHTTPTTPTTPSGKQHQNVEDPNLINKSQNETMKITPVVQTSSGAVSVEQGIQDEHTGGMFTTKKESLVPHAKDISEEGELDGKRETELDVEFIVVTTPKNLNAMESTSNGQYDRQTASETSDDTVESKPAEVLVTSKVQNTLVVSKDSKETAEDYDEGVSEELLMAVGGSGDIGEDLYRVTTSSDVSSEEVKDNSAEEVTESVIIVREEGSDLEASPEKYTTVEEIHPTEPGKATGDQNAVQESTPEAVTKPPRPNRRQKITPRPGLGAPRNPKPRKAPGAAIDIPDKPTTMINSAPPPSSGEEPQLSTPSTQEVIIDHRNSTRNGLSLAAKTGIAAGCVVAFWLILGPIVCCLCRMKDTPKEAPPEPGKGQGANGALVEEMVITELARGRDKKYNTTVENDQEITSLNQPNQNGNLKHHVEV